MFTPVPKSDGPIKTQSLKEVSSDSLELPPGFEWVTLDISLPENM